MLITGDYSTMADIVPALGFNKGCLQAALACLQAEPIAGLPTAAGAAVANEPIHPVTANLKHKDLIIVAYGRGLLSIGEQLYRYRPS